MFLKQSTSATIKLGPFLDDTDGKTAETLLSISQSDVRISKNGGAFAAKNEASAATHDENGFYAVALDTTDTGTLGRIDIAVFESGAIPVYDRYFVVPATIYDWLFGTAGPAFSLGTESYATEGSVPTMAQALFMMLSRLCEFDCSSGSTAVQSNKLDGTTKAMDFTLNSASNPTKITRS